VVKVHGGAQVSWSYGPLVKTLPFQGEKESSNPARVIYDVVAQLAEAVEKALRMILS